MEHSKRGCIRALSAFSLFLSFFPSADHEATAPQRADSEKHSNSSSQHCSTASSNNKQEGKMRRKGDGEERSHSHHLVLMRGHSPCHCAISPALLGSAFRRRLNAFICAVTRCSSQVGCWHCCCRCWLLSVAHRGELIPMTAAGECNLALPSANPSASW